MSYSELLDCAVTAAKVRPDLNKALQDEVSNWLKEAKSLQVRV